MNAEDEKKLQEIYAATQGTWAALERAYEIGRRAGLTDAAGICTSQDRYSERDTYAPYYKTMGIACASAIEKARGA